MHGREPGHVTDPIVRGERRRPNIAVDISAQPVQLRCRLAELRCVVEEAGNNDLARWTCDRRGRREEVRGGAHVVGDHEHGRGGGAVADPARRRGELGVVAENRLLEGAKRRRRLDSELVHESPA